MGPDQPPRFELEPHHVDILALGLIAVGILLGGVAYAHWDGGTLGNGAVTGLRFVLGALGYVVPAAFVVAGGLVLAREPPAAGPSAAHRRHLPDRLDDARARCGHAPRRPRQLHGTEFWRAAAFEDRGGVLGQGELWATSHLISTLGADILAVFLFAAGVILVTGATLAGVIRATGAGVAGTTRVIRRSTENVAATRARRPVTAAAQARVPEPYASAPVEPLLPPEPDTSELIVRSTHVEAPPIFGPEADEEEPSPPEGEDPTWTPRTWTRTGAAPRGRLMPVT